MSPIVDELLNEDRLAADLDVPKKTVAHWRYAGTGPRFMRIGKHVRYRRSDVEQWLSERYAQPA